MGDLFKLDPKCRDKDRGYLDFSNGTLQFRTDPSVKDYPTLLSLHVPLAMYFRVLIVHSAATGKTVEVALAMVSYLSSLVKLSYEFEWPAVLAYHMAFFSRRRWEMQTGVYSGWQKVDAELYAEHLISHRKAKAPAASSSGKKVSGDSSKEVCRLFNTGACPTNPCRNGRIHKCSTCGKSDHGAHACPTRA